MGNGIPVLFESKSRCCGCGACMNACPRQAIRMEKDEYGFLYPVINEAQCVSCGLCKMVCAFTEGKSRNQAEPQPYAAASCDAGILKSSASGGIFAELAKAVLARGGTVFGAAWNPDLTVSHVQIENAGELWRLQGSKYVQSDIGAAYSQAEQQLKAGKEVLFSGTPCQIAGLYGYLKKEYASLYTVDLICHGVPNATLLREDLQYVSGNGAQISQVSFRDKAYGWGTVGSVVTKDGRKRRYSSLQSPYYAYFLEGAIYRDSCYHCRFPSEKRVGDITLGDYWGVESAHQDAGTMMDIRSGVSCVLVNSENGKKLMEYTQGNISWIPSDLEKIRRRNGQLVHCCAEPEKRKHILQAYQEKGYQGIVSYWKKRELKSRLVLRAKSLIPYQLKHMLKKVRK